MVGIAEAPPTGSQAASEGAGRSGVPRLLRRAGELAWRPIAILVLSRAVAWMALSLARPLTHARSPLHIRGWDSGWYIRAAEHGWPHAVGRGQSTLAFLPALPTLIRVTHFVLPVTWTDAGYAADFICQIAMVLAVWLLARDVWGQRAADRGTLLLCFAPGAFVFSFIYTEPLLIASAAVSFLAMRKRHWELAGIAACIGTLSGPNDFPLVACCIWAAFLAIRRDREWRSLSAVVLSGAGIAAWFIYLWVTTGSLLAWLTTNRRGWHERLGIASFPRLAERAARQGTHDLNALVGVFSTVVALTLLVLLLTSTAPSVMKVYAALIVAILFFSEPIGMTPRFAMVAFPLLLAVAARLKGEMFSGVLAFSAMSMGALLLVSASTIALTP
jgi:hypothetical protein